MRRMYFLTILILAIFSVSSISCSSDSSETIDGDADTVDSIEQSETDGDDDADSDLDAESEAEWSFNRNNYEPVHGWILLDSNPEKVREGIETAAEFGVNHIQLSHNLIMNIDEILYGYNGQSDDEIDQRVETLNLGIDLAHQNGMKAFIWAHELSETGFSICWEPGNEIWQARADAYREGLAKLPNLDGVILMFGSAPAPPWTVFCNCDWCDENYPDEPIFRPSNTDKVTIIMENIGNVIVNELGKELFVRTFVHEPGELEWHSDGLAASTGVNFTGMHKGAVQDWEPYNPHHANMGAIGPHPSIVELDTAGEYYGQSVLPFASPGYYWYRMNYMWQHRGIGAAIRIERGSARALGTPNEVNIYATSEWMKTPDKPIETIWDEFISYFYGLSQDSPQQPVLKQLLKDTFPIRRKSHYVLGMWALEKGSDIPTEFRTDMFDGRGKMPKWDEDWQERWDRVNTADKEVVNWIWQEATEAVDIATADLAQVENLQAALSSDQYQDLLTRMKHQKYAAETWRAVKLLIYASKASVYLPEDTDLPAWIQGAYDDLERIAQAMTADGITRSPASPSQIEAFRQNARSHLPQNVAGHLPDTQLFSPLSISDVQATSAKVTFMLTSDATVTLDYGVEIPDYGETVEVGQVTANTEKTVTLTNLQPSTRHVVRLRSTLADYEAQGGDYWIFTPAE